MAKTIPQLTDATTVGASDEMIIQQSGITKRATINELKTQVAALGANDITVSGADRAITNTGNFALAFGTNNTERARITSGGSLLVGVTSVPTDGTVNGTAIEAQYAGDKCSIISAEDISSTSYRAVFLNSNGLVGTIVTSGSSTSFNTSSDYRLKHDVQPMTGALAKVAQLNPVTFKWNADNSSGQGFIAHELQAVVPECVSGEKDAVNADGSIKAQGVDASFLIATLVAAIQELAAKVEALENANA
jgi:hypothetical protein